VSLHHSYSLAPNCLSVINLQQGVQAGAIFVDYTAEGYFRDTFSKLNASKADLNEYVTTAMRSFERVPKRAFEGVTDKDRVLKIGAHKLSNAAIGVKRGNFTLTGYVPVGAVRF
jgi:hypothetical protein